MTEEEMRAEAKREARRRYYQAHRDELIEASRKYRAENPEKVRRADAARREANRERRREQSRRWARENPERVRESAREYRKTRDMTKHRAGMRKWKKANPEKCRESDRRRRKANREGRYTLDHRRRARKKAAPGRGWTAADVAAQHAAQRGRCFYCGALLCGRFHRDHITPLSRGGAHCRSNLALACPECNTRKGARDPQDYAGILL